MKVLVIVNDAPYGSERAYSALRLAGSLARRDGAEVRLFLIGDGAVCAKAGQKVPMGHYNVQTMLVAALEHGAQAAVCGTCMDARGLADADLVPGAHRGSMEELTSWALEVDRVITF